MAPSRRQGRSSIAALAIVLSACGDAEPAPPSPLPAGIEVSNLTSGDPLELDGYTVTIDAAPARPLPINQSIVFPDLEPGDHAVALGGVEHDCRVLGVNPRTVHITGGTAASLFLVTCVASDAGRVVVQTYTGGDDDARYTVELSGGRSEELGAKDAVTFYAVPEGPVTLTLSGASPGCNVLDPNPRTIQVRKGAEVYSRFKIYCTG